MRLYVQIYLDLHRKQTSQTNGFHGKLTWARLRPRP